MNRASRAVMTWAALAVLLTASPVRAQSRVAILDATGVTVLDTTTGQVHARFALQLELQESPRTITASADGRRLFITTTRPENQGALHVLDASTGDTLARVATRASTGRTVVLPDGLRALLITLRPGSLFLDSDITIVDLSSFTTELYPLTNCPSGSSLAVHPDGGMLYLRCSRFQVPHPPDPWVGHLLSVRVTPTGLEPGPGLPQTGFDPIDLSVSPDGTRVLVSSSTYPEQLPMFDVYDTATSSLLDSYALFFRFSKPMVIGRVRAQSASRVFMRLTMQAYNIANPFEEIALFDDDTNAILGQAFLGGVLVGDQTGSLTFALESNRLSRLDNDTAAPTTIATGPGGWLDAAVITDVCPLDVTASAQLFTTAGGAGTLTIDAAPSCAWTVDAGELHGVSFGGAPSGQGSATLDFSLAPATAPQRGALHVGAYAIALEQTMPVMHIDAPAGGAVRQPFTLRGWAIDVSAAPPIASSPTVSGVHVWAWPMDGGAPLFVGATGAALARPDVGAIYGTPCGASGFELSVRGLPSGPYTIVAYARSARTGTFTQEKSVLVTVQPGARIAIEAPAASVARTFVVSGWAADGSATIGPGVDLVHVWAYPASGAGAIWVGATAYGGARADIAGLYGESFRPSGYSLYASLPPGRYTLVVFARSTVTGEFNATTAPLTVLAGSFGDMNVDAPGASSPLSGPFEIRGWAIDRGAETGSGVDALHIWAFPIAGGDARFLGIGSPEPRPDVAGLFGPQFANAGFLLSGATLPAGPYDLVVYARSAVTGTFNNATVVRIVVQ